MGSLSDWCGPDESLTGLCEEFFTRVPDEQGSRDRNFSSRSQTAIIDRAGSGCMDILPGRVAAGTIALRDRFSRRGCRAVVGAQGCREFCLRGYLTETRGEQGSCGGVIVKHRKGQC